MFRRSSAIGVGTRDGTRNGRLNSKEIQPVGVRMPFLCNMIRSLLFTLLAGFLPFSIATAQTNIAFVGQLDYQQLRNSDLSNLWGYTDELGNEYAIVGVNGSGGPQQGGVSIVDLSDPTQPQEIFFVPGPS